MDRRKPGLQDESQASHLLPPTQVVLPAEVLSLCLCERYGLWAIPEVSLGVFSLLSLACTVTLECPLPHHYMSRFCHLWSVTFVVFLQWSLISHSSWTCSPVPPQNALITGLESEVKALGTSHLTVQAGSVSSRVDLRQPETSLPNETRALLYSSVPGLDRVGKMIGWKYFPKRSLGDHHRQSCSSDS